MTARDWGARGRVGSVLAMRRSPLLLLAGALALAVPAVACGGDDATPAAPTDGDGPRSELTVHGRDDLTFDQDEYTVEAGTIDVTYINDGSVTHTLLIKEVDGFKLTMGGRDEGTVALEPGEYVLYCDIAGHEAAGMVADLVVE